MTRTLLVPALQLIEPSGDILEKITAGRILYALIVLMATYLLVRIIDAGIETLARRVPRARFFVKMSAPAIRIIFWFVASAFAISIFSPSRETVLALLASFGIAVGLGAQDLVKNVFGGLVILTDRPYQLGDRVRIGDAYGEVDHIGLRSTKLTTPDDTRVTIPNSTILTGLAWNSNSGVPDCQVVTDLYLPHDTDPGAAREIGLEAAFSSPYLLLTKPVVVHVKDGWADNPFMMLRIKAYVYDHRFENTLMSDITLRAKSEFLRRGILFRAQQKVPT